MKIALRKIPFIFNLKLMSFNLAGMTLVLSASAVCCAQTNPTRSQFNVALSIVDAIDQALSVRINGKDLHSHQLATAAKHKPMGAVAQSTKYAYENRALCGSESTSENWAEMDCRASNLLDSSVPPCDSRPNCMRVQLAPFVINDPQLLEIAQQSMKTPCATIDKIKGSNSGPSIGKKIRSPASLQSVESTSRSLNCGNKSVVAAKNVVRQNDVFIIYW